jgi:hypothetical protein
MCSPCTYSTSHPAHQFTALLKEVSIESEEAFAHLAKGQDFINRTAFADAVDAVFHAQVGDDRDGGGGGGVWGGAVGALGVGAREGLCCPLTSRFFVPPRVLCAGRLCGLQAPSVAR